MSDTCEMPFLRPKKRGEGGGRAHVSLLMQKIGPRDRSSTALYDVFQAGQMFRRKNGPPDIFKEANELFVIVF